jgi:hypothetical protein
MFQVLEDAWTKNREDAQKTFDLISSAEKHGCPSRRVGISEVLVAA